MELQAAIKGKKPGKDEKTTFIIEKVKTIVYSFDPAAEIILFGSRARGDWHEGSDWDFLILTDRKNTNEMAVKLRLEILHQIELVTFDGIFVLVHNKKKWEEDYSVTPLYYNISEEGIKV
ncbi:MAG: nucleotidyltransferase domain-containing protein [Bacteroidota bacterium]|nr:nucleotidyltransferase domain-containing protein [Bacteroidota bacterium]